MMRLLLFLCAVFVSSTVYADDKTLDLGNWSSLPVLYEGRVEPLDSFARLHVKKFSGKQRLENLTANEWLAFNLFDPANAVNLPTHKIRVPQDYGLKESKGHLYSYSDIINVIQENQENINALLQKDASSWTPQQEFLVTLYEHYILHTQILRSLTLILPIGINNDDQNFMDFKKIQQDLQNQVENIIRQKGTNLDLYNDQEREISFLSYQLNILEKSAENNVLLRIIPEEWSKPSGQWHAPWSVIQAGVGSPKSSEYLKIWRDLAQAYRENNQALWDSSVGEAKSYFKNPKLSLEVLYNKLNLTNISLTLFSISLVLMVVANLIRKSNLSLNIEKISGGFFAAGTFTLSSLIALRVYLLDRPPVGTLYESILFVALICAIGFALMAWRTKKMTPILLGALSGVILMTTALGFVGNDTMGTLVAVLNTNFWLGTHVLCITMGYGTCLIASLMAHYDLWMRAKQPHNLVFQKQSMRSLQIIVILSLLLTTIGTILGGIWADQSWGRFWGWDPKENGALLIVLWLAWIIHSKISNHLSDLGYVMGTAFLSVIIVLAWFGVNLLNVGLHSYGFISGIATGIGVFCSVQIIALGTFWFIIQKKRTA